VSEQGDHLSAPQVAGHVRRRELLAAAAGGMLVSVTTSGRATASSPPADFRGVDPPPEQWNQYARHARAVSGKVKYPLRNVKQVIDALGGDDAEVDLGGKKIKLRDARKHVPRLLFPVDSEEDLIAKMATVDSIRPGHNNNELPRAKSEDGGPEHGKPPAEAPMPADLDPDGPSITLGRTS
jgi:hypothetical protein